MTLEAAITPFAEDPEPTVTVDGFTLALGSYEGPIDLLLTMARDQKVDLRQISILALAEQYLLFVEKARAVRMELAADYLVMAAWLAYLKSKLLLPVLPSDNAEEELSGEAMAEALAFQLQRLEAMQKAAQQLFGRPRLGFDRFSGGGLRQGPNETVTVLWQASLYDILDVYGDMNKRQTPPSYDLKTWPLVSMEEAQQRLANMLGAMPKGQWQDLWSGLARFMPAQTDPTLNSRSALASMLTAALELVKQERLDLQQDHLFAPIFVRPRSAKTESTETNDDR